MVIYEDEKFLKNVLGMKNGEIKGCCLEKPYDIT